MENELRTCPISGRKVIISPKRAKRFRDVKEPKYTKSSYRKDCPFCYGKKLKVTETMRIDWEILDKFDWDLRSFLNLSPYLVASKRKKVKREPLLDRVIPYGTAEVLVESRLHNKHFPNMTTAEIEKVFVAYKRRYGDLLKEWNEVLIFRNYGYIAGQSITHPHSQVVAMEQKSPAVENEEDIAQRHWNKEKKCVTCEYIKKEFSEKKRVIMSNDEFVVIAPWASVFPYEFMIFPKKHEQNIRSLGPRQITSLAEIFFVIFRKLKQSLRNPSYNYYLRNFEDKRHKDYTHWHIRVLPRGISIPAGFELGTKIEAINIVPPEDAAKLLREQKTEKIV